jgi:hypothetical protein
MNQFKGVRVFSATKATEREQLGEKVTAWIEANPKITIVEKVVAQSSDSEFHCLSMTFFFDGDPQACRIASVSPPRDDRAGAPAPRRLNFAGSTPR